MRRKNVKISQPFQSSIVEKNENRKYRGKIPLRTLNQSNGYTDDIPRFKILSEWLSILKGWMVQDAN